MPGYSGLYRVGPLTDLKRSVFFSALNCLPRGSSLKVHRLRHFTAKGKFSVKLHIFVTAVHCSCQYLNACRVYARLISKLKFISTLFIYYITMAYALLTFWRRNYFFNFNTPCIQNVNNIGTKYVRIMKQAAF